MSVTFETWIFHLEMQYSPRALCNKHAESYAKLKALQARNSYAQIEHLYIFFQQVQNSQGSK